ncbi:major facilitator superfamily domain-containing protein [Aspergillus terricola var. indicus]
MTSFSKTTEIKVNEEPVSLGAVPPNGQPPSEQLKETKEQQDAVRVADAITATWLKKSLITSCASMWMLYFVNGLNNNLTSNLSAYITSDFSAHSLLTVISVVMSVMGAACLMPIAKVPNLWDRTVGVCIMILIAIIGLIMMACCNNIATYCAAQVGIAYGFTSSPNIITAFAGSPLSNQLHETNWRWAVIGIFLMTGGLILFLTSFNTTSEWRSTKIIAMMVVGFFILAAFAAYERWGVPKPFISYHLLVDRTVIGACLLDITYQVSYYCWASYFTSSCSAIFDLMDPVWLIGCGFLIPITGRFKWILMWAVPLYLLASGLMIYSRTPGHSVGYMCMCQIFLAVGGGTMILIEQVAVLAASRHEDYAAMLALLSTFGNIGSAVGSSVSGAIWTNTLPQKLREYLPAETRHLWSDIYDSLDTQLSYPNAYASSQRKHDDCWHSHYVTFHSATRRDCRKYYELCE